MIDLFRLLIIALKRLVKSLGVIFRRKLKLPIKPIFINFPITYRCNSRCRMCNIWKKYKLSPTLIEKELSKTEVENFLKKNINFLSNIEHIGLTGGEPILREDIVEIVALFHKYLPKARVGIQTNGLLPEVIKTKLTQIKRFYPDIGIAISLDGLEEIHDKVRGKKGAFNKFKQTIAVLKELKIKRITSGLTISKYNYKQIEKVSELINNLNIEFSCFLPDESSYYFGNSGEKSLLLNKQTILSVISSLKRFSYHYYMDNLRRFLEDGRKRRVPCYSGYTSIVVDPYGNVRACVLKPEIFGNIKKKTLKDILFDEHGWKIRNDLKNCTCWSQCEMSTSVMVDFFDLIRWFIFDSDKRAFINSLKKKVNRL